MDKRSLSIDSDGFADLCLGLLPAGKSMRFTARGSSMQPLVRDGDVLIIEPAQSNSLHLGMIVLCLVSPGRVVVHRVIRVKRNEQDLKYLIQGDNVEKPDGWFTTKDILGNIKSIERDGAIIDLCSSKARVLAKLVAHKVRHSLNGRAKLLSYLYSRIKRLPIFKVFFS